ncbi:hypothetical protein Vretifemale_14600 [Volvox reticuliferus]|uniref:PI3K/PI4K catalytic domain-containing protein n=1 Tax=Volvox reticuliferus TaxID=1737510 RepID=A0A8J4CQ28_9CHLO|nr:hypothetical protein Vretifemale_14600 [Volvox reticuliferus]
MARDRWIVAPLRVVVCSLMSLCIFWGLSIEAEPLPHIDDCYLCQKCHTGKPSGRRLLAQGYINDANTISHAPASRRLTSATDTSAAGTSSADLQTGHDASASLSAQAAGSVRSLNKQTEEMYVPADFKFQIMPLKSEIESKSSKPNCTECYGCDTQIVPLQGVVTAAHGQELRAEVGASPEWLFLADMPDTPMTGKRAVVKVWCMPIDKVHGTFSWRCSNTGEGAKAVQFLLAQQKVMEECGLMDVTIKVWPGRVNAVVPGHGLHVWWDGLWMERAEGLSLNQISYKRTRNFVTGSLKTVMGERLNKTLVVRAALYDLLSSQCDRHSQNVFITESGQIKLIDNLQALQFSWVNCAMDSIFLPGTQKNMVITWGGNVAFKIRHAQVRRSINPMVVLDYRCYVEGGRIGKNYDPKMRQCLTKLRDMTPKQIQLEYGFPYVSSAAILQQRASDMINKGFEWTLRYGKPRSFPPKAYRPQEPCCGLDATTKGVLHCAHPWTNRIELPYGDPQSGGEWHRPYPDPGTHIGGTYLDFPQEGDY